jgi:hypothetical protein
VKKQMVQWFSDHSGKNEKRGIPLKVFQIFRKFSIGKARSIWFPTRKTGFSIQMESAQYLWETFEILVSLVSYSTDSLFCYIFLSARFKATAVVEN